MKRIPHIRIRSHENKEKKLLLKIEVLIRIDAGFDYLREQNAKLLFRGTDHIFTGNQFCK